MQIIINEHSTSLEPEAISLLERRLHLALGRFADVIKRVTVRMIDIKQAKGGMNKQCLLVVKLQNGAEILIQGKGGDCGSVLNHCADRMSRAVERQLTKRCLTTLSF